MYQIYDEYKPDLETEKAAVRELLRKKRKEVEYGGFVFNNERWDSGEKDELRLNSVIKIFELTGATEIPGWRPAPNVEMVLTLPVATAAATFLMKHYSDAFATEKKKNEEIDKIKNVTKLRNWVSTKLNEGWE